MIQKNIDTSQLLTRELKQELEKIFVQDTGYSNLFVTVLSFGFKYGIPDMRYLYANDIRFLSQFDRKDEE
jgi:UPF0042 nucleotide-binding protein